MPKAPFAIRVRNVNKSFHQGTYVIHVLKDINFDANSNELLMIVGPSGCGKTTLLSVVAGTLSFDSGEIEVFNTSLNNLSTNEITTFRRENVGFIFQQFHLIPTLNCVENVAVPLLLQNVKMKEALEKAAAMMEMMGLGGREKEKPKNLSGGQQQRIAIARALIHDPKLIICDEPTSSLDAETGCHVMELLSKIAKTDERCVLVVTHDNRIFSYADRITKMNDGKIVENSVQLSEMRAHDSIT